MKKALSLFLAILMVFSVLSVASFATDDDSDENLWNTSASADVWHKNKAITKDQVVLRFNLESGNLKSGLFSYDQTTGAVRYMTPTEISAQGSTFVMLPYNNGETIDTTSQLPGATVTLPELIPQEGYSFIGWQCQLDNKPYTAMYGGYTIPKDGQLADHPVISGTVIDFVPIFTAAQVKEDTFAKVFDILSKIFGTIIGLIAYDGNTDAGIAFIKKIFSGITG